MAWEWLEKYLKGGMATQGVPDVVGGEVPTRGLFGTGGNWGQGGLLTTFNQPSDPGKGMLDLFSNLPAVTGMEMIQGGMTGKPIEQTLLPAFKTSLKTTTAVESVKAARKQREFIKKYESQVPEGDLALFRAFPVKYVSAMLQRDLKKDTLADAAKRIYDTVQNLPKGEQSDYINKLAKVERDLYNRYIKGEFNIFEYITGDKGNTMGLEIGKVITNEKGQKAKVIGFNPDGTPILEPVIE